MALSRQQKETIVAQYEGGLANAANAIVMDYTGITVPQVTDLRNKVRASGGTYLVIKNTLVRRAASGKAMEQLEGYMDGPTAVAFTDGDVVGLAKTLTDFAKDVPVLEFKAGLIDSQVVAGDQIKEIAALPSREELISKLLYLLQSPVTRLARGLAGISRNFVVVLDQISAQKGS